MWGSGGDELRLDGPTGRFGLADQYCALDDEGLALRTRTAAPQKAPQFLNLRILEGQLFAQSESS